MEPTSDPDNTHVSSSACDMVYCGVSAPLRNASEDGKSEGKSEEEDTCVYWVSAPLRNACIDIHMWCACMHVRFRQNIYTCGAMEYRWAWVCIHIHIAVYLHISIYISMCVYIYKERERERERERENTFQPWLTN